MDSSQTPTAPASYRFGDFELRLATRELLRHGIRVEVQPKVLDLVLYLIEQRDRLVDKDELQDAVWPRQVITEAALQRAVMKARKALDDDASRQRCIRTEHSRGYRFVAPVHPILQQPRPQPQDGPTAAASMPAAAPAVAGPSPVAMGPGTPAAAPAQAPRRPEATAPARDQPAPLALRAVLGLGAALLVLAATLIWLWRDEQQSSLAPEGGRARLAILPLENRTGDSRYDWIRLGLAGAIEDYLSQGREVDVVPVGEVERMVEAAPPALASVDDLARLAGRFRLASGATHVVVSRIEPGAGQLQLHYRIADAGGHLRERSLVGPDPGALMRGLASDLHALFAGSDGGAREAVPGDDFVNEAYLRGKSAMLRGDLDEAERHFDVALDAAPTALWPRYELAIIERSRRNFELAEGMFEALIADAVASGNPAVEFGARNALGNLYYMSERIELAEQRWTQALDLARRQGEPVWRAKALSNLSIAARIRGDRAAGHKLLLEAVDAFAEAGFEQPPPITAMSLGNQAHLEGDLAAAERFTQQAIRGFGATAAVNAEAASISNLAHVRRDQGRLEEARGLLLQAVEMLRRTEHQDRAVGQNLVHLAWIEAQLGRDVDADRAFDEAFILLGGLPERLPLAFAERRRGEVLLERGALGEAAMLLEQSAEHAREGRYEEGEVLAVLLQGRVALAGGDADRARAILGEVRARAEGQRWPEVEVEAAALAAALAASADPVAGVAAWDEAAALARRLLPGSPWRRARMDLEAAALALRAGEAADAGRRLAAVEAEMPQLSALPALKDAVAASASR